MGAQYDAPNQQVVRPDGSGPGQDPPAARSKPPEPKPAAKPPEGRKSK